MQKLNYTIVLFLVIMLLACKKKDSIPEATATTNSSVINPTGLSQSTGGDYCNLQTSYTYVNIGGVISKDSLVVASFYTAPSGATLPTNIYAGTVTLNGVNLPFESVNSIYYISTSLSANITAPITWSVSGSNTVTAFSQSFTPSYPKYTGGNSLPDTCVKANGITINVNGVSNNQNSVVVYLNSSTGSVFKYILGSTGSVYFNPTDLAVFTTNQFITISLNFTNSYTATHNGIKRGFSNSLNYQKISYLK
jgi:hypothetical protein